jgi:hypothetical protein
MLTCMITMCVLTSTPLLAGPARNSAPAEGERRAAAKAILELLDKNFCANKVNYHFNRSGESVCWATAGLAFLASGSRYRVGRYQKALKVVFDKLKNVMDRESFQYQPVWGCAQATVFLAELHRTAPPGDKPAIRELMAKYVTKLEKSQTSRGGWCHTFEDKKNSLGYDDLMATTVMALQGLGMARREGLTVNQKVIDLGIKYIEDSSNLSRGYIGYSPRKGQKGMRGPGRTAGGLLALMACGKGRSPLAKAAGKYLSDSFVDRPEKGRPQATLNAGHASAQMGQMWAAWWAAENKCYDQFWAGQGALIMGRRKANGEFKPAPSDGETGERKGESGDFANAMHALMLTVEDGRLAAGTHKSRTGPARVADAIDDAFGLVEEWGSGAPDCLKKFAALGEAEKPLTPAQLSAKLKDTVSKLAKTSGDRCAPAILQLLGLSVEGKAETTTVIMSRKRILRVTLSSSTVRLSGVARAKAQLKPNDAFVISNPPALSTLVPTTSKPAKAMASVPLKSGSELKSVDITVEWDLAGLKHTQDIVVPVK